MKKRTVSVVIPNYNGRELLEKNLPFLQRARENKENKIAEVIIVDDGSTDGSEGFIKSNYPGIKLILHQRNRGFSAAVNTGVKKAKGNLVVLLNTDVLPDSDFLTGSLKHFEDEMVFAVSLHEKGYGWNKGIFKEGFIIHRGQAETDSPRESFWASGGSGIFRKDIFLDLGGMDDKLLSPFYWEDIDLSYRARKRGYKIIWEPKGGVIHQHESTTETFSKNYRQTIQDRNQLLFTWKNLTSPNLFRKHLSGLTRRVVKGPGYLKVIFLSLLKLKLVIQRRNTEKKEAKISDEQIFTSFNHA